MLDHILSLPIYTSFYTMVHISMETYQTKMMLLISFVTLNKPYINTCSSLRNMELEDKVKSFQQSPQKH